jgi:hypothetical protein
LSSEAARRGQLTIVTSILIVVDFFVVVGFVVFLTYSSFANVAAPPSPTAVCDGTRGRVVAWGRQGRVLSCFLD